RDWSSDVCSSDLVLVAAVVMAFGWQLSQSRGLPVVLVILAVLVLVYAVLTQSTVFGRHVYAIGGNLNAARLSGVRVRFVNFWIMVNIDRKSTRLNSSHVKIS